MRNIKNPSLHNEKLLPLRDVVFMKLRKSILEGEMPPGSRLMEVHIAKSMGVSRTPVRDAIKMLEQEGLATIEQGKGARVAKMTKKDVEDVLQVRSVLDTLAAKLASQRRTEENLEMLSLAMLDFEDASESLSISEMASKDEAFHSAIYTATHNDKLTDVITQSREQLFRYRFEYVKDEVSHPRLIEEHREIFRSIREKDADRAVLTMKKHIDGQMNRIFQVLNDD